MMLPRGTYGRISSRSFLWEFLCDVKTAVIDNDYRGEIMIPFINHSSQPYYITEGDRIAQIVVERFCRPRIYKVDRINNNTVRGEGGFGSTGKR